MDHADQSAFPGEWTASRINRLGRSLRASVSAELVQQLDEYRRSFSPAYFDVAAIVRQLIAANEDWFMRTEVSGRIGKSTPAVVAKIKRLSTRLATMQDIAGLRVVTADIAIQDAVVRAIQGAFERVATFDRRAQPSHGYRAVHLMVMVRDRIVEVQVRTVLQHLWAQLSEKMADRLQAPGIKYGEYPAEYPLVEPILAQTGQSIARLEERQQRLITPGMGAHSQLDASRRGLLKRLAAAIEVMEAD